MKRTEFDWDRPKSKGECDLIIFDPEVMNTPAGYYVGACCAEWVFDSWVCMPYDRYSTYMTKTNAEKLLEKFEDEV